MKYISVEEARDQNTLRLVLCAGTPGVWGEAVKAIFAHKGIDYVAVAQDVGGENEALREWTGQTSAPALIDEDGLVRTHWEQFIGFAEQRAPQKPLVPDVIAERVQMYGLCNEIAGVDGFGWCRRLQSFGAFGDPAKIPVLARMAAKYGYSDAAVAAAGQRCVDILGALDAQLTQSGGPFYFGERISALDFYSAIFLGVMLEPLAAEIIPMNDGMRAGFAQVPAAMTAAFTDSLKVHRDRMFGAEIATPLDF